MKPALFEYHVPSSLDEALSLLAAYGDEAKVLAGGQSLVPLMNLRLAKPAAIVDINRLPHMDYVERRNGVLAIGALTRHRSIEYSSVVKEVCPLLQEAAGHVADLQVRNRGTFGGSIAHADPASEFCAAALTLGGEITASRKPASGRKPKTRRIPANAFFAGPLMTVLEPDELVTEVSMPAVAGRWSFRSVEPRHGDLAIAGVMVTLTVDARGVCQEARIGMFGVGPTPLRATTAEEMLAGNRLGDRLVAQAAQAAAGEADPVSDVRATAEYRRELVERLAAWNLRNALGR